MTTKIILRQHAVIPRSLNMAALAIDTVAAAAALGIATHEADAVMGDLSNAGFEQVQRLLATKGLTLTLVPASGRNGSRRPRCVCGHRDEAGRQHRKDPDGDRFQDRTGFIAVPHGREFMGSLPDADLSYRRRHQPPHSVAGCVGGRLSLAIVSENSTYANCARVHPSVPGMRKESADATFFDSLVKVAAAKDADGFRARTDLHVAALFDRMYFTGAAMRITFPDGEECDAYTSEDVGAAVGTLMGTVGRQKTAKELGLSLPMYDALATHPAGHRTTTLLAFLEKAGAKVSAVKSERKLGWATAEEVRPVLLRA